MSYFREINYLPLRTMNQGILAFNIRDDEGKEAAEQYFRGLSTQEKALVLAFYQDVKARGAETVKKEIMRAMPLQDDGVAV